MIIMKYMVLSVLFFLIPLTASGDTNVANMTNYMPVPGYEKFDNRMFVTIDKYARSVPSSNAVTVEALASYLDKCATNDVEKVRAIYIWITEHISYDFDGYWLHFYGNYSPENVLKSRKSVCGGYATLFKALADRMDLTCVVIGGVAFVNPPEGHAWNAVSIDGKWYLLDSTWGSEEGLDYKESEFFLSDPKDFIFDHYPNDSRWQLLEKPLTYDQFLHQMKLF
jgi:transglutaminase/protease-like cytokinesis protein 3